MNRHAVRGPWRRAAVLIAVTIISHVRSYLVYVRGPVGGRRSGTGWRRGFSAVVVAALVLCVPTMLETANAAFKSTAANPSSALSANANFSAGALNVWGDSEYGQNGQSLYTPQQVGSATWSSVGVGYYHTCGIQSDASLWCWGDNTYGELGVGDTSARAAPTKVGSASWASVTSGWGFTCGLRTNQTVWCWGENDTNQLGAREVGDGTTTNRRSPTHIGALTTWKGVSGMYRSTCGTLTNRTVWCWGDNAYGQLGQGDTTARSTPTQIPNMIAQPLVTGPQASTAMAIT
jgi:hypothetical protein